jgi:hypothetical protein
MSLYNQALDDAHQIERRLEKITTSKQTTDYYYNQAQLYIYKIHDVNRYSYASNDPRAALMAKHIVNMKKIVMDFQQAEIIKDTPSSVYETRETHLQKTESSSFNQTPNTKVGNIKTPPANYLSIQALMTKVTETQLKIKGNPHNFTLLIDYNELIN